ncbi:hypothetical protein MICAI_2930006 [Microcystis sp. T1-4]|nr:hypothetical protein MICAI_2930006 [Microcystis sp. T1-4]
MSQTLGSDFYFATPYHSWERGLNEPNNRPLRQFSQGNALENP